MLLFLASCVTAIKLSTTSNVLNPGFEGAKVYCYGTEITSGYAKGLNTVWATGSMNEGQNYPLAYTGTIGNWHVGDHEVYWGTATSPQGSQQELVQDLYETTGAGSSASMIDEQQLQTRVEENIQLQGLTAQGAASGTDQGLTVDSTNVPLLPSLGTNTSSIQEVQYWNVQPIVQNGLTVGFNMTKEDVALVQADFYIDVYVVPCQASVNGMSSTDAHASGWQEGSFTGLELWYELTWYQFGNSLGQYLGQNDPTAQENLAMLNAQYGNMNATEGVPTWAIGGGAPITAWVQQVTVPYMTSSGQVADLISLRTNKNGNPVALDSLNIDANSRQTILAMVNALSPANQGNYIDLYSQPSDLYSSTNAEAQNIGENNAAQYVFDASTEYPNQYFKISVSGFGTAAHGSGGFLGVGEDWTVYYPSVSYLVHVVFLVYGTHTYLWTLQTATTNQYPGYTPQTTSGVFTPGPFNGLGGLLGGIYGAFAGLGSFLTSPLGFLITAIIVVMVIVVVLALTGVLPGLAALLPKKTSTRLLQGYGLAVVRGQGRK
jgi:hypothetical protein